MNRIRELRHAAGLSTDELAKKAGMSVSHVRLLETGERPLDADARQKIARALECAPTDLAGPQ